MHVERRRSALHPAVMIALWLVLSSCGEEPFDWCTEALEDDFTHATGTVSLRYEGSRAKSGTVQIDPYVRFANGAVTVQGCANSSGDLWRYRGIFVGITPGSVNALLAIPRDTGPSYGGDVRVCEGGSCGENKVTILDRTGASFSGSGVIADYRPDQGVLRGSLDLSKPDGQTMDIELDIQWDVTR